MFRPFLRRQQEQPRRRGAALVEMAIVSPLLISMILGIIEFGRALTVGQLAAAAVRDATRYATNDDVTTAQVKAVAESHIAASTGIDANLVLVSVTVTKSDGSTNTNLAGAEANDLITVEAQIPFNSVGYITGQIMKDKNVVSKCAMWHR